MTDGENDEIQRQQAADNVEDEAEKDTTVTPVHYEITSFGADYDFEGLVKRLLRDDVYIPPFQRSFVWTQREASRFIESLLLGLPVPGVFLARDYDTKRLLVIDGQQRLRSMQFFYEGYFDPDPDPDAKTKTVFKLLNVQKRWEGLTYATLEEKDRIVVNDSIIHATIVKQDSPADEGSSIYHIFERLNTTGRKLSPQQIRVAIYHGKFLDALHNMNNYAGWRGIFGRKSKTLKDEELILRFLALYYARADYGRDEDTNTLKGFLNHFAFRNRKCSEDFCNTATSLFQNVVDVAYRAFGEKAFRQERTLNAAVCDSVMVGIADRLQKGPIGTDDALRDHYAKLLTDDAYRIAVSSGTSHQQSIEARCAKAIAAFSNV